MKKYPMAHVTALDYFALSVEKAKEYNKAMIAAGRCEVLQGDVSELQLPAEAFDLATAFETVYFWPGLEKRFTKCGICTLMKELGLFELVPAMCRLDYTMREAGGATEFVRDYTLTSGGPYCDCGYKRR